MASKNNQIIKKETIDRKSYTYRAGSVSLDFVLRTDIKEERKLFVGLLKAAVADIEKELNESK